MAKETVLVAGEGGGGREGIDQKGARREKDRLPAGERT